MKDTKGKMGAQIKTRGIIPERLRTLKLNGGFPVRSANSSRFMDKLVPKNYEGLVLKLLINYFYGSFYNFSGIIGKTRGWEHMLIFNPEKVRLNYKIVRKINDALGVEILTLKPSKRPLSAKLGANQSLLGKKR